MRIYFSGNILALLTVLFVGLKLTDFIDWSWWWVLSPLWLPTAVVLAVGCGVVIIGAAFMSLIAVASFARSSVWTNS